MSLKKILQLQTFFILLFLISGCTVNYSDKINDSVKVTQSPKYQIPQEIEEPKPIKKGSLFNQRKSSLFTDKKDLQIGDIIYIEINEEPTAETKSTKNTTRGPDTQVYSGGSINTVDNTPSAIKNIADSVNGIMGIGATFPSLSRDFSATAETTVEDIFENQVSAVVTKKFKNGNYFIEGFKEIAVNGQKQTLKLSGVLNPENLKNNVINAKYLANLKIVYFKKGEEQEYIEKNWGHRIMETITPF